MMEPEAAERELSIVEREIIGYIVSVAAVVRLPKSVGEIFGLLYISRIPLSMDRIMQKLGVSLGTASQGIKTLRSFGAIRSTYIPGERKEHFVAETDFRKLLNRLILDDWRPKLEVATERLEWIESQMQSQPRTGEGLNDQDSFLNEKLVTLKRLNDRANLLFKPISKIIGT
ncbi:MAG: HTH domain-containing protein [Puniceicoccaceae bacterium]